MIKKFLQNIFKKFFYYIFIKIYGKIENSVDGKKNDKIDVRRVKKEENLIYQVYKIKNGRLYSDRVHDTAFIINNKIIEGPSFQFRHTPETKVYLSNIKQNIVFTKGTPRKLKKLNGTILSLLTGGGGNDNYWHWLFDVLPRINLCNEFFKLDKIDYFLFPSLEKKFQIETLDLLNIPIHKRLSSEKYRHIQGTEIIGTDHPVVTSGDATEDHNNPPTWIIEWLKNSFVNKKNKTEKGKKIYIDRSTKKINYAAQRVLENEEEIKQNLLKNDFIAVKLHELKFIDQVNLFNNAKCVVGLHGAGFVNLVFCQPETKVIELRSPTSGDSILNVSKKNNLNYDPIVVESKKIDNSNIANQQGSYRIPINNLIEKIKNI